MSKILYGHGGWEPLSLALPEDDRKRRFGVACKLLERRKQDVGLWMLREVPFELYMAECSGDFGGEEGHLLYASVGIDQYEELRKYEKRWQSQDARCEALVDALRDAHIGVDCIEVSLSLYEDDMPIDRVPAEALQLSSGGVAEAWRKMVHRVSHDADGAITAAKSLVESVCKHILDEKRIPYERRVDLPGLYKMTAKSLKLAPDDYTEDIFKQILGGCDTVVSGLSGLRGAHGDAHGHGSKRYHPHPRHARLAVNCAGALSTFLIDTHLKDKSAK